MMPLYSYLSIRPAPGLVMFYQTSCLRVGVMCSPPDQGADLQAWCFLGSSCIRMMFGSFGALYIKSG
jgi:hypothetical protein